MDLIVSNRALSILHSFFTYYKKYGEHTILLPSNICLDVFFIVLKSKLQYRIIDIEESNLCINRKSVHDYIKTNNNTILLYNHTYGVSHSPYDFFKTLKQISSNILIIDDRCLCIPSMNISSSNKYIDLIIYSTGKGKQIDLEQYGFAISMLPNKVTQQQLIINPEYYPILKATFDTDINKLLNDNALLDNSIEFTSAPAVDITTYKNQIETELNNWEVHKNKIRNIYQSLLPQSIQLPSHFNDWRFNITVKNKSVILNKLFENDLYASSHYPSIGTKINCKECKISNKLHGKIINLFIDKYYTEEKALNTVKIINDLLID